MLCKTSYHRRLSFFCQYKTKTLFIFLKPYGNQKWKIARQTFSQWKTSSRNSTPWIQTKTHSFTAQHFPRPNFPFAAEIKINEREIKSNYLMQRTIATNQDNREKKATFLLSCWHIPTLRDTNMDSWLNCIANVAEKGYVLCLEVNTRVKGPPPST